MEGGVGFMRKLPAHADVLAADGDWSAWAWIDPAALPKGEQLIAGLGSPDGPARYFMADGRHLGFWWGGGPTVVSVATMKTGAWQFVAAVVRHGRLSLYLDGREVLSAPARQAAVAAELDIGPVQQPWPGAVHFGGRVAGFTVRSGAVSRETLQGLAQAEPSPTLTRYELAGGHWPLQTQQMAGQVVPQPPATLPRSRARFSTPHARKPGPHPSFGALGGNSWVLGNWRLASATKLPTTSGAQLSRPTYSTAGKPWVIATVPGTVLTTLVNRGVYPNPAYGLNNMDIPESLHEHDWWYRTRFRLPRKLAGRQIHLTFGGINYGAEVWVNGTRVGTIRGAFVRGRFDITKLLRPGQMNAIAVRISPPPNGGVPQEESLRTGPGPDGGAEALDGPTFIAAEGWDWIPSIRDRETGIWQKVTLHATGEVRIGDPKIVTHVPVPNLARASVDIDVPLRNASRKPIDGTLRAAFGAVSVDRRVTVPPGGIVVHLNPSNAPQLVVHDPHLWWPNGYGAPYLYQLNLSFAAHGSVSDTRSLKFGIRQVSYELSLFNDAGKLQRYLLTPESKRNHDKALVNVRYTAVHPTKVRNTWLYSILRGSHVPSFLKSLIPLLTHVWAYSLAPGADVSPAVKSLKPSTLAPFLVIRVNGVRIAAKGGSWGMDDFMKRVSVKRLEPYFKLQRKAHLNIIRNWVGQSTEPAFFHLANKYGMLVINEFWESTGDYNMEPMDDALFLRNAADVIRRYRNDPSIVLWFGRNEGVPQPLLNKRLQELLLKLDGTRLYMPSSNLINLAASGPYDYQAPENYFTELSKGFAVEVGAESFPTLRAFEAMMPKADRWPVSDDWAYHDWHQQGNGDVHSFVHAMTTRFGAPTSLADFERKAQMMNYVDFRAIFEGFNAHLWTQNSGRMLWMTQSAWPDVTWNIYSHDYDAQASYYGVKEAAQPIHVQINLPDYRVMVVNNTRQALSGDTIALKLYGLGGRMLGSSDCNVSVPAGSVVVACGRELVADVLRRQDVAFASLVLADAGGHTLSRNFYWMAKHPGDLKRLDEIPKVHLRVTLTGVEGNTVRLRLANTGRTVALNTKLTLLDAAGHRILPAYYSDNYVSLAPGASESIEVTSDADADLRHAYVVLSGWNAGPETIRLARMQ